MLYKQMCFLSGKKPEEEIKEYRKESMDTWAHSLGSGEIKRETILESFKRYLELDHSRTNGNVDKTVLYSLYIKQCEDGPSGVYNKLFFRVKHLYKK